MPSPGRRAVWGASRLSSFWPAACPRPTSSPWYAPETRPPISPGVACRCARQTIPARAHWARRWPGWTGCCWSRAASWVGWSPSTPTSSGRRGRPGSRASCTRACSAPMPRPARWPASTATANDCCARQACRSPFSATATTPRSTPTRWASTWKAVRSSARQAAAGSRWLRAWTTPPRRYRHSCTTRGLTNLRARRPARRPLPARRGHHRGHRHAGGLP